MIKRNFKTGAAVVLAGVLFAAGGMGAATAKDWIDGSDLKPGSVNASKLSSGVLDGIKGEKGERGQKGERGARGAQGPAGESGTAGAEGVRGLEGPQGLQGIQGPQGPQGPRGNDGSPASDIAGTVAAYEVSDGVAIANIGGRFADRATVLDTFTVPAGKYVVTANGFFHTLTATSGATRMQLAVRVAAGSITGDPTGTDVGTCFTDNISPTADREATCSSTRVVEFAAPTAVTVYGFGYADNQGSADSSKVGAVSYATFVRG